MAKTKMRVYISWCICCHDQNATLYNLTKEVKICKRCREQLIRTSEIEIFSKKGKLVLPSSRDINQVEYLPYKTEEDVPDA